jgi:hypothetical protein
MNSHYNSEQGNVVGIATSYGLDGPEIEYRWGRDFSQLPTPALGPIQPPVQWVKIGRSVTLTPHPLLVLWSWNGRAIPLLPLWVVQPVQSLIACTRMQFTLPLQYRNYYKFRDINYSRCFRHTRWQALHQKMCHLTAKKGLKNELGKYGMTL